MTCRRPRVMMPIQDRGSPRSGFASPVLPGHPVKRDRHARFRLPAAAVSRLSGHPRRVPARFADSPARVARRRRVTAVGRRDQDRAVARVRATGGRQRRAGRDRQLPGDGRNGKRRRARRRGARVRRRPRRVADDEGRAAHRVHAGLHQADGRAARAGGEPDHVGDRQEPRRFAEGVRPHRHVHDADDRRAEGARQREFALRDRRRHDRPDPPHAARRRAVHGSVQLPAERNVRDADPRAADGQHRGVRRRSTARCCSSRCSKRSAMRSRRA